MLKGFREDWSYWLSLIISIIATFGGLFVDWWVCLLFLLFSAYFYTALLEKQTVRKLPSEIVAIAYDVVTENQGISSRKIPKENAFKYLGSRLEKAKRFKNTVIGGDTPRPWPERQRYREMRKSLILQGFLECLDLVTFPHAEALRTALRDRYDFRGKSNYEVKYFRRENLTWFLNFVILEYPNPDQDEVILGWYRSPKDPKVDEEYISLKGPKLTRIFQHFFDVAWAAATPLDLKNNTEIKSLLLHVLESRPSAGTCPQCKIGSLHSYSGVDREYRACSNVPECWYEEDI